MKPGDKKFNIEDNVSWYDHETKFVFSGHIVMKITFEDIHYNKWRRYKVTMGNNVVELSEEELFPTREACIEHYIDLFKSLWNQETRCGFSKGRSRKSKRRP